MNIIIIFIGLIFGFLINTIINIITFSTTKSKNTNIATNIFVIFICSLFFFIAYFRFGLSVLFFKSVMLAGILIVVSIIDFKYMIIPNSIIIFTLMADILFFLITDTALINLILGMLIGGGILFLLALIPNAMGGGDVKLMFALGGFLGLNKTLYAIFFAFIFAAIISIILILFKIRNRKDHIPFGPFLALGSFFSFILYI